MPIDSEITAEQSMLLTFFHHHLWFNLRLFDACLPLTDDQLNRSDPGTYGSIRATLVHLVRTRRRILPISLDRRRTANL